MNDLISRQKAIDAICSRCAVARPETCSTIKDGDKWCEEVYTLLNLPSVLPERNAPISYKEQLSLDCSFCRQHECGDTLYESSDWDGGIGFDYIRDIRFCPICGRRLYDDK